MSGVKQAALLLHGLDPGDQDWLMARLAPAQRASLAQALDELRALGIARDEGVLDLLLGRETPQDRLARATGPIVVGALDGEAPEAVAMLLRLHPWPWRQAAIAHWSAAFQARPGLLAPRAEVPGPALKAALIEAASRRVARGQESRAVPRPAGRPDGWRSRLPRWLSRRPS